MTTITIGNKPYELDSLSVEAKRQLQSLEFCDSELARLQAHAAVLQTARAAYSISLQALLPVFGAGDTIKLPSWCINHYLRVKEGAPEAVVGAEITVVGVVGSGHADCAWLLLG